DGIASVYLKDRGVCIAGKPAPTEKQSCINFRLWLSLWLSLWLLTLKPAGRPLCSAFDLLLILI
ncbi:hypothetical protein RCO22_31495, partial [Pseudomonas yamanorum]|nr:hypothetical protein [Pseudomonas yamanorum]